MITITMPLWMNYLLTAMCGAWLIQQILSAYVWWLQRKIRKLLKQKVGAPNVSPTPAQKGR